NVMDTMSAIKIPLLVDVYRQVDAGKINTADRIVMKTADKSFGPGVPLKLDPGLNLSFRDALELMIIQSDNSATDMAFARVGGPAHVTQTMHELGSTRSPQQALRSNGFGRWPKPAIAATRSSVRKNSSPKAFLK